MATTSRGRRIPEATVARLPVYLRILLDQSESGYVRVSLCGDGRTPAVDGALDASPAARHQLLVNARVVGDPEVLSRVVGECLRALDGELQLVSREAFRPSPPVPERRA